MWKITEIQINNIVSIKDATLKIEQGVATLIFGRNEDNESQPCNGSGKSSLIEAISFALTGEQLRKVKTVEEIINDDADEAFVSLRLSNEFLGAQMTINRRLRRKGPQQVQVLMQTGPYDTDVEEVVEATVADYNKYILEAIGLTKDDIYNTFILCDNKYESFFDCPDRGKKDIINRFSNGVIVDEAIARLQADLVPVAEHLADASNKVLSIKGSVEAITKELEHAEERTENAREDRKRRIDSINEQLRQCAMRIDSDKQKIQQGEGRMRTLKRIQEQIFELEEADMPLSAIYQRIVDISEAHDLERISDFKQLSALYHDELDRMQSEMANKAVIIDEAEKSLDAARAEYTAHNKSYQAGQKKELRSQANDSAAEDKLLDELNKIEDELDKLEASIREHKKTQADIDAQIAQNQALLSGTVACPKCGHKFLLTGEESIELISQRIDALNEDKAGESAIVENLTKKFESADKIAEGKVAEIDDIRKSARKRGEELNKMVQALQEAYQVISDEETALKTLQQEQSKIELELDKLRGRIENLRSRMFGEITGVVNGHIIKGQGYIDGLQADIVFVEGQAKQYEQSLRDLQEAPDTDFSASLRSSLEKYREQLAAAYSEEHEAQTEFNKFKQQEAVFTAFKSHIARKKIDALSMIVNDFLEKIGSDIRLRLEGFTLIKSGKLRDKISVRVIRDGVDCGSYQKFSGGEKARLNLASILSLHTLVNSNCEDGKGLDFIIIDELLDKSDEMGMATYCEALNKLGQTALLITQGSVSEGYPHRLLVVKKHGVSSISE